MKSCQNPNCNNQLIGRYQKKFCSPSCAAITNNTKHTKETKLKISKSLKEYYSEHEVSKETKEKLRAAQKNRSHNIGGSNRRLESVLEASSRTTRKIITRIGLGCSNCGWDLATCDLHHIRGRKVENAHSHKNLCLLCPNCHRLADLGELKSKELIPLSDYWPENWRDEYYG